MGKTAFIDGWDRIGKPKDISDVDGPKVATEQYIFSCQTAGNLRECMNYCLSSISCFVLCTLTLLGQLIIPVLSQPVVVIIYCVICLSVCI